MSKRLWLLAILCLIPSLALGNDFYTHGAFPAPGSPATSAGMRAEFDAVTAGFDKLPALSGNANKLVIVNGAGTALSTVAGTITIPQSLTVSGAYDLTLNLTGTTSLTLPTTGTVATLSGTETLSNKTLASPLITGSSAIGTTLDTKNQLVLGGSFTPGSSSWGSALSVRTSVVGQANQDVEGVVIIPSAIEASSGTHPWMASLDVSPQVVTAGTASVTNAATVRITGAPTNATSNYALYVSSGEVNTEGGHMRIGVSGTGGSFNPYLKLNDGTSDSYLQMTSGNLSLYTSNSITFSPGSAEKARLTNSGILLVGSTDSTSLTAGGIGLLGGMRMTEISDPSAPSANNLMLYARDDGSGNTVLAVRFPTGAPITIARENVGVIPPGTVHFWGGGSAPSGWLLTNGAAVSRTTYAALFTAIGTTFGTGDGSTTFNVPNLSNYATNVKGMIKCKTKKAFPWRTIDQPDSLRRAA